MTADEISELARTRKPFPNGQRLSATMLYYTLRGIYRSYEAGEITAEQGKRAKADAIREFGSMELSERVYFEYARRSSEISRVLAQAEKCDRSPAGSCEYCKEISRLFDGRQRNATLG